MIKTRTAVRLLVSALVFLLCAEAVALVWYYATTGTLFYERPEQAQELEAAPADRLATDFAVHPYFGFAHILNAGFHDERTELLKRDGWPESEAAKSRTNNFGFISPYAYPLSKSRPDQFFVGIFGGSVGMWFCQVAAPGLIETLKQHAYFQAREIVPLCFSQSGYKQPQLAQVLGFFLSIGQPLDLVVNIDGFNDVALGGLNDARGLDISMPSAQHIEGLVNVVNQSTLTPAKLESLAAIVADRSRLTDLDDRMRRNRSAAIHLVLGAYHTRIRTRYVQELARYDSLPSNPPTNSLVQLTPPVAARDRDRLFGDIAALWARSSILMRDMLAPRGASYVHILQPNQYATARRFSGAEAAIALNNASPYKRNVEEGYPRLQAAARTSLLTSGVAFFDATHVLDNEPSAVYVDDCCHYNVRGNRLLADFVAASILKTRGPWNP